MNLRRVSNGGNSGLNIKVIEDGDLIRMLSEENKRLRKAGSDLSIAALIVATEYDGVHRLMLAVSSWAKALADEHGRGDTVEGEDDG